MSQVPHRIRSARAHEAGELFTLRRAAYVAEAQRLHDPFLPQLLETVEETAAQVGDPEQTTLVAVTSEDGEWGHRGRLIGCVRLEQEGEVLHFSRLVVAPDLRWRGIGSALLDHVVSTAERTPGVTSLELDAQGGTSENLAIYRRYGFVDDTGPDRPGLRVLSRHL